MKKMKHSFKSGLGFGLTSGVITTLGLMVGLFSGTNSKLAVIGGILTIAISDSMSDALGIHVSQESQNKNSVRAIWEATLATFLSKLILTLSFIIPVLTLELFQAIIVSVIWGLSILSFFSFIVAKQQQEDPWKAVAEHLTIDSVVVLVTYFVGNWISLTF